MLRQTACFQGLPIPKTGEMLYPPVRSSKTSIKTTFKKTTVSYVNKLNQMYRFAFRIFPATRSKLPIMARSISPYAFRSSGNRILRNTHSVFMRQTKEEREAKAPRVYIGRGKAINFTSAPVTVENIADMPLADRVDDLPF